MGPWLRRPGRRNIPQVQTFRAHPSGGNMRKIAAVLVAAATLGVAAQSASADVPNPDYQVINYGPVKDFTCRTAPVFGDRRPVRRLGALHRRLHGPAGLPVDELQQDLPRLRADDRSTPRAGRPGSLRTRGCGPSAAPTTKSCGSGTRAARGTGRARTPPPSASRGAITRRCNATGCARANRFSTARRTAARSACATSSSGPRDAATRPRRDVGALRRCCTDGRRTLQHSGDG